ncbi:MAG: hypothetical protein LBQ84_07155 [Flavobacteriaceae bacterium]|jgi:hypothetical protein|nr:hypothetical protein [Flavobacteriaceae bacterium]
MKTRVIKIGFFSLVLTTVLSLSSCEWFKSKPKPGTVVDSLSVPNDSLLVPREDSLKIKEVGDPIIEDSKPEAKPEETK